MLHAKGICIMQAWDLLSFYFYGVLLCYQHSMSGTQESPYLLLSVSLAVMVTHFLVQIITLRLLSGFTLLNVEHSVDVQFTRTITPASLILYLPPFGDFIKGILVLFSNNSMNAGDSSAPRSSFLLSFIMNIGCWVVIYAISW